ncbi:MAG: hypothetical protein ACUVV0_05640 [Anaerolineae bacterium]
MDKEQIFNEIKRIEQELYLKRSQLAAAEAMKYGVTLPSLLAEGFDVKEWKKVFSELIEKIGQFSSGSNSVEDIRMERQR